MQFVFLQVTFPDALTADITEGVLGGGVGFPHQVVVLQEGGVVVRVAGSVVSHLLLLGALRELVTV